MKKIKVYVTRMEWRDGDPDSVYAVPTIRRDSPPAEELIEVNEKIRNEMQKHEKLRGLPIPSIGYFMIDRILDEEKLRYPQIGEMLTIKKDKIGIIEDIVEIEAP